MVRSRLFKIPGGMNNNGAPNYFSNNMEGLHFFRQNLEVCIFSRSKYERAVGNRFSGEIWGFPSAPLWPASKIESRVEAVPNVI